MYSYERRHDNIDTHACAKLPIGWAEDCHNANDLGMDSIPIYIVPFPTHSSDIGVLPLVPYELFEYMLGGARYVHNL